MDCKKIKILFDDFLENKLSEKQSHSFLEHLESCSDCNQTFILYKEALNFIENDKQISIDESLYLGIKEKLEFSNKTFTLFPNYQRAIISVAASIVILVSVISGYLLGNSFSNKYVDEMTEVDIEKEVFDDDLNFNILSEQIFQYESNND